MRRIIVKFIISILIVVLAAIILIGYKQIIPPSPTPTKPELTLANYPEVFKKDVVIVIGENASQIEKESAQTIANNLENLTGNKPEIIEAKDFKKFKSNNLIIVGTPVSNKVLGVVYEMTNATRVTNEYPGEGKGVLEILRNPWNADRAMLLVVGIDEWGVEAGSEVLKEKRIKEIQKAMTSIELQQVKIAKDFVSRYSIQLYTQLVSNHIVLQDIQQIPYQTGDLKNPINYKYIVQPPNVTKVNNNYTVKLYTWTEYGGVLVGWRVKIEGQIITHIYAEVIETHVGHFSPAPAEGFIPSPGIILVNEKI